MSSLRNNKSTSNTIVVRSRKSPSETIKIDYNQIRVVEIRKELVNKLFSAGKTK